MCEDIYYAKPIALHIIGKPIVGDLKRPFEVAGMFGTGAFSVHMISLLPSFLTHCYRRKKKEACGDNAMSTARGGEDEGSERE